MVVTLIKESQAQLGTLLKLLIETVKQLTLCMLSNSVMRRTAFGGSKQEMRTASNQLLNSYVRMYEMSIASILLRNEVKKGTCHTPILKLYRL